ncbi:hypothetical protein EPH95_10910 [Salicibibacter halophilus]|uniref:Uncharacterized protein n=1 Tax=Salicibibacter halophilus TaxID=2502791 RepID=A0A514LID2_9BACI|nr:hypothetical protein [Salicibibacter halophilus]QDI91613.1 hypothetical protein EPH95_10910 [Salicibibacter halophilus]
MGKDDNTRESLALQQKRNEQLVHDIMHVEQQIAETKKENEEIMEEKEHYERKCAEIERSLLWKGSKPIRKLRARQKRPK